VTLNVDESAIEIPVAQISDLTATATELNYTDGVTSSIQDQLDDKAENSDFTGGTEGYTAVSNGASGLSYQPISHNYVINGGMDIWQRGNGPISTKDFLADRWKPNWNGSPTVAYSRQDFAAGDIEAAGFGDAQHFLRLDLQAGDAGFTVLSLEQNIEDVRVLAGQEVTVSFYAKASIARTLQVRLIQLFGSGGSSTVTTVLGSGTSLTTDWTRISMTGTLPSVDGKTIGDDSKLLFRIQLESTDLGSLDLWGVQLEAGSIATPFKRNANSIQGELAACQRYYQKIEAGRLFGGFGQGFQFGTTLGFIQINLPVTMRTAPNSSIDVNGDFNLIDVENTKVTVDTITANTNEQAPNMAQVICTATSSWTDKIWARLEADSDATASIGFSAEL